MERIDAWGKTFRYSPEKSGSISNPTTTIVIPSYNSGTTIQRSVVSSLAQETDYSYNVLVVDDGSDEPVKGSLGSLVKDPRISVLRQSNGGASMAMNLGGLLSGENIIRLDADDELLSSAVQVLTDHMGSNLGDSYAFSDGYWVGPLQGWDWEKFVSVDPGKMVNPWEKREFDGDTLLSEMYFGHARIFRRDKFLQVGGYDPRFRTGQDWDFALKMAEVGNIQRVPKKLHKYYLLEGGLTNTHSHLRKDSNKRIVTDAIRRRGLGFDQVPNMVKSKFELAASDFG